jgi:hypothetical protein
MRKTKTEVGRGRQPFYTIPMAMELAIVQCVLLCDISGPWVEVARR